MPLIQRLVARNWNFAISGLDFTASRVAKSVAVSTPLRIGVSVVVMMWDSVLCCVPWMLERLPRWLRRPLPGIRGHHGSITD